MKERFKNWFFGCLKKINTYVDVISIFRVCRRLQCPSMMMTYGLSFDIRAHEVRPLRNFSPPGSITIPTSDHHLSFMLSPTVHCQRQIYVHLLDGLLSCGEASIYSRFRASAAAAETQSRRSSSFVSFRLVNPPGYKRCVDRDRNQWRRPRIHGGPYTVEGMDGLGPMVRLAGSQP
jgi:hypothetical protein